MNGFTLKRRKTTLGGAPAQNRIPNGAPPPPPPVPPFKTPGAGAPPPPAAPGTGGRSPAIDEYEISEGLYHSLSAALGALPEAAPAGARLAAVAGAVCDAERAAAAGAGGAAAAAADALAEVFAAFGAALRGAVDAGEVRCAASPGAGGAGRRAGGDELRVDLAARKAGLRARLRRFAEEEAEWAALLAKAEAVEAEAAGAAEEAAAAPRPPSAEAEALRAAGAAAHRRLATQVDAVAMLVGDCEALAERAGAATAAAAADHQRRRFGAFPHVDSPARLIRALVHAPAPAPPAPADP